MSHVKLTGTLQVAIHSIAWGLMFVSPVFALTQNESLTLGRYVNFCIGPLSFFIVFYLNYFLFINRLLFHKRFSQFVLFNLLLIVAVLLLQHVWHDVCDLWLPDGP